MCLVSDKLEVSITTTDITCYKILIPMGGKLFTPYRDFVFNIGEVYSDKADENVKEMFNKKIIESGYFHSLRTIEAAKEKVKELYRCKEMKGKSIKIFEAVIPKGVKFYEGQFEDICSKSLKIIGEYFD